MNTNIESSTKMKPMRAGGRPGPSARVAGSEVTFGRELFMFALVSMEPAEQSQRKAVAALLPEIHMLRSNGFSWVQIAGFLKDCKIKLLPSTVRQYYGEMISNRMDECTKRMNEQVLLMAELRKTNAGESIPQLAERTAAILARQRQRADVANRVAAAAGKYMGFGEDEGDGRIFEHERKQTPAVTAAPVGRREPAARLKNDAAHAGGEGFGFASMAGSGKSNKPAFFDLDEPPVPSVANLKKHAAKAAVDVLPTNILRCMPIMPGVTPIARRAGVNAAVYDSDELMEHPAIAGLMLTKDERIYGAFLEYINRQSELTIEEMRKEKSFRIKWTPPIPMTPSSTSENFVKMDYSLFK